MKYLCRFMALIVVLLCGPAHAASNDACIPYKVPIESTVTACGQGLMGSKYKYTSRECPSGKVTAISETYDTSGCVAAPVGAGSVNTRSKCQVTPDACANAPVASACPAGQHWSTAGSGIAHCVADDPDCGWGKTLTHDSFDNPSCVQNTCPSNQVLQANGVSCGCQSGMIWNGSSCIVPVVTCIPGTKTINSSSCTWGGTQYEIETTVCPAGPYGAPSKSSTWDTSGCAPRPITCQTASSTETDVCGDGFSGTQSRQVTTTCPGGQYGTPTYVPGAWDRSQCTALPVTCTPDTTTESTSCGSAYNGNSTRSVTTTCPSGPYGSPSTSYGAWNNLACSPKPVTCTPSTGTEYQSCSYGYSGNETRTVWTTCPSGSYGAPSVSYGGWSDASCTPLSVSCTPGGYTETESCGPDYDGDETRTQTTSCPDGSYGAPSVSTSGWDRSSCTPKVVTCSPGSYSESQSCGAGYDGNQSRTVTTSCPAGQYGAPSTGYGAWDSSSCVAKAVTCSPDNTTETQACGDGYTGDQTRTVLTYCPSGSYGSAAYFYGGWDRSQCSAIPTCTPTSSTAVMSCGGGYNGSKTVTTTYLCPSGTSTSEDTSGCSCANGGTDYPTCSTPKTEPPPVTCPNTWGTCIGSSYYETFYGPAPSCTGYTVERVDLWFICRRW